MTEETYEDTIVQSNLNGFHTKRRPLHEHEEVCNCEPNHRKVRINEVLWDIDLKNRPICYDVAMKISERLLRDDISHSIWDTSRSYHIHSFWDLHKYPKEARKAIRLEIMKRYAQEYFEYVDRAKASEDVMIREFNATHEVTGGKKTCIFDHGNRKQSEIPQEVLKMVSDYLQMEFSQIRAVSVPLVANLEHYAKFVDFCQKERFDQSGGRNMLLFKNIGIALFCLGIGKDQAKAISLLIGKNSKGKKGSEVFSWYLWAGKQRHQVKVNWGEVKWWYDHNGGKHEQKREGK